MKLNGLKNFIGVALVAGLILGLALPGFSMFIGNHSEKGFDEEGTGSGTMARTSSGAGAIEDLVIKSATYFLQGKAHVDLLASRLEAADHDGVYFDEYQTIVDDALDSMKASRQYYQELVSRAKRTPYKRAVIRQLKALGYDGLAKKYRVNGSSFSQVKKYLKAGDVRGTYSRLFKYTNRIINILETVQKEVNQEKFPKVDNMWQLNQECTQMLLFGQYMAVVFGNTK
ncbi:MAG: hypothetical protein GY757_04890 [bacterium]|nr:hypothetical protein [bacterium]